MYKNIFKRVAALVLAIGLLVVAMPFASAEKAEAATDSYVLLEDGKEFTVNLTAEEAGEYLVRLEYEAVTGKTINPKMKVEMTVGETEYSQVITLSRVWYDDRVTDRFLTDELGNELVPEQVEVAAKQIRDISLLGGDTPLALEAGDYELKFDMTSCAIKIYSVTLLKVEEYSYEDYLADMADKVDNGAKDIFIEAEITAYKSSAGIIPTYDTSDPDISPSSSTDTFMGLVSAGYQVGQWVEWTVNAESSGWYKINFNYRQNSLRGLGVRRFITLDGEHLFDEFDEVVFGYGEGFQEYVPEDENGDPYLIYLSEGEHTLRLSVTLGALYEPLNQVADALELMNEVYRDILAITGADPDIYRDYYLEDEIPDLIENLEKCCEMLESATETIEELCGGKSSGSATASFTEAVRVMKKMIKKPYRIPNNFSSFKSQIDSVASQNAALNEQPMELDTIELLAVDSKSSHQSLNFFQKLVYHVEVFINSFVEDYNATTLQESGEAPLKVWLGVSQLQQSGSAAGREQLQIVKQLCAESFDYPVELSLVNATEVITQAIISGKGPDVVMFVPEQNILNLAARGALADFNEMENIEEIKSRFHESAMVAATWDGGLYGLPETQTWFMMFCRTDILAEKELEVPTTWTELLYALQVLRQSNLMVGVPSDPRVYEALLLQSGGAVYNDDFTATRMTETVSVEAFEDWTDFYIKHSTPLTYDFYNRFRTGEMPIGIQDYTLYNQLVVAAPELTGLWEMYPIPGTEQEDGSVSYTQPCTVNSCIVVESSKLKDEAFDFCDWWTSNEVQQKFGYQSEIILGTSARYNSANVYAIKNLNWTDSELNALVTSLEDMWDTPKTPASYYYDRNIVNAFRRVVYDYESARDVIGRYAEEIDREIERKNEQLAEQKRKVNAE